MNRIGDFEARLLKAQRIHVPLGISCESTRGNPGSEAASEKPPVGGMYAGMASTYQVLQASGVLEKLRCISRTRVCLVKLQQ